LDGVNKKQNSLTHGESGKRIWGKVGTLLLKITSSSTRGWHTHHNLYRSKDQNHGLGKGEKVSLREYEKQKWGKKSGTLENQK